MSFKEWKAKLVTEVDDAAAWCAERALADPDDPRNEKAQKALVHLADRLRALPADHKALTELFREEQEFSNLARAVSEEPEHRYRDAKEELLRSIVQRDDHDATGATIRMRERRRWWTEVRA